MEGVGTSGTVLSQMASVNPTAASVNPIAAGRSYGGQTSSQRAADRRELLLDAAFTLVAADGWKALRIDALCREAGLNKRYFYESFPSLDAVIGALTQRLASDAIAVSLAELESGVEPTEVTRRMITALIHHLTDDPRRARVLFGSLPAGDAAAGHRTEALRRVAAAAATTGRGIYSLPDDPFVDITAGMLVAGTSQVVLEWLDQRD